MRCASYPHVTSRGYTMIELIVSMVASTALLLGLASSTYIARQTVEGKANTTVRAQAADVQSDMLNDLRQATGFTARSATLAQFTVPDRNSDGAPETITYQYTGAPSNQLTWSQNGSAPLPVLDGIDAFQFTFLNRSVTGVFPPPGIVDMNTWGNRWITSGTFGYTTLFPNFSVSNSQYVLVKASLPVDATARSICVYLKYGSGPSNTKVRCAIYAANGLGQPSTRLAQTAAFTISGTNWYTFDLPSTMLTAGDYYLAVSYPSSRYSIAYTLSGGPTLVAAGDATTSAGFPATWTSGTSYNASFSIYCNYDAL